MGRLNDISRSCAIVTGASGGIGFRFCEALARRGCGTLVLVDISGERLRESARSLDGRCSRVLTFCLDLTREDVAERLEQFCNDNSIDPDILINNAGVFSFLPIVDTPEGKIDAFIDLHVRAVTVLSRWFASRRKEKGSGWLLNMSSMSCWMPMPGLAMYAATKSYIRVFTRSLRYEMKDSGVNVMAACPGGIATNLFGLSPKLMRLAVGLGVVMRPEKFVDRALGRMLRGHQQYINGLLNRVSIVFVGVLPTWVRMMVKHHLLDRGITR